MKKTLGLLLLIFVMFLLVGCNPTTDPDDEGDINFDEYDEEELREALGDSYRITYKITVTDEDGTDTTTFTIAVDDEYVFYSFEDEGYLFSATTGYLLDLEEETKEELPEILYHALKDSIGQIDDYMFAWFVDLNSDLVNFKGNGTVINRPVKIYEFSYGSGEFAMTMRYHVDNQLNIALKYEYTIGESSVVWEITELKIDNINLTDYLDYETVVG